MKKYILIILILFIYTLSGCDQRPITTQDCSQQIDSLNKYWIDVVKNVVSDSVEIKDSINWIDSTRWSTNWVDSINWIDSVRWTNLTKESYEIPIDSVRVDTYGSTLIGANLIDGILYYSKTDRGTRWGASGYPHQAVFFLDDLYVVTEIWINSYGWDQGYTHKIDIYNYSDKHYTIITAPEKWSEHKILITSSQIYLDVISGSNNWTDIGEIKLFGYKIGDN